MDSTIIAASLNDKELKSSIDTLVSYVDQKIKGMATNFDNEVKRMKESLQNLGNIKIDSGSASDGGSARRTKRNTDEAKSVRETTVAYEQLATAVQNATKPKSAEQSFYAFIQNYREHAAKLASELKTMPSASLDKQMAEYQRFEREINAVQRKIQELRQQLNNIGGKPSTSRFEVKAITDEINRLQTLIRQLTSEQISSTRRIAEEDNAAMVQKRALYERTVQLVRELTTEQANSTIATQRQNEVQDQLTRKIQRQAEIIRQRLQENGGGVALWGSTAIYDPNDARNAKIKLAQLSIEEQLLQAHQQQVAITQERIAAEQRENKTKQETVASTQAQVQAEQQVTQAQQQRTSVQTKKTFQSYEDFAQALAHVLGLQQQEIQLADSKTASYNRLQQTLKTLQSAYNQLSNSERNSDNGKTLVASMHEVQRAIQKIQQQAARPVNLMAAIGLSEKTLDDIAYKMQMLSRYRNGIDLTNPNSRNEIQRVNSELERLKSTQDKLIGQNARYAHSNELLGRSFDYIKNRIAFVLTIGTMTQFTKSIYEIRGQYELLERSIGILFDSMQQGSQIFAELNAMAIKSPFTTMELGAAAKQLSAYDIAAKDVVDTTRRLADMAAAVGVPIERLTYALGQIKAYGYLNARDARMFANAGIPLVQNLADMYTKLEGRLVSVGDIYDRIKKKAISFEDVLKVVNEMTDEGGRFFNFQEKAADTLKVKLANLTLAYNNMLNEIGKSNQTLITAPLVGLKKVYENWRSINNIIRSLVLTYGLLKGAQILYIAYTAKVSIVTAAADVASKKLVGTLYAMKGAFLSLASNPFTWITAVLAGLGYMYFQMRDLDEATERFNKSISQNAQENIDSINKFFNEYKKDIDTINSLNTADQQKMWERIREEIEKTSKNAKQYIDILEKINNVNSRVKFASDYLSQLQQIQQEAQRLADHGFFSVGGGFADDGLADDLAEYEAAMNKLIKKYGSLEKADEHFKGRTKSGGDLKIKNSWGDYISAMNAAHKELNDFTAALDKVNLGKVLGEGTNEEKLANLREFATIIRDNFLATEKGQKISSEGQALLNRQIDNWIAKKGVSKSLLNEEHAQIEANRTAWELFFNQLNKKEKETVDYLVATNQTGSEEFKKIWDNAAKRMKDSAITSYQAIQEQIATLRNTPDIVISVVYKQNNAQLDEQQQQYKETFLTPEGKGILSAENYLKQVQELTTKYGRFQKKENENNVEWEKRLGETYRDNESSLKHLNAQLKNSANLSDVDRKAKEGERDALIAENKVLDEIKTKQNFNYEKDKKDKKGRKDEDIVAEALKQELQLIKEMQSNYDKLRKSGVSNMDAIDLASKGYEATIIRINQVLSKFGIDKFNAANFAGKDVRSLLQSLEEQRQALLASGKVKTSSLQALDVEIQKLTVDAKTYDMKKVTDGLNSELGKIKDEYELAIELDANPELGGMFADMFGIDTDALPQTFGEALERAQKIVDAKLKELKITEPFDLMRTQIQTITDEFGNEKIGFAKLAGQDENSDFIKALIKAQDEYRKSFKKNLIDTEKYLDDYVKKYGDYSDKVAEIERNRLKQIRDLNNAYYTEQMRKSPEYKAKENAINQGAQRQKDEAKFDAFKNSQLYIRMFENLDYVSTQTLETMKKRLEDLKNSMKNLSPEQLKQIQSQYQKITKELSTRNPFKGLIKNLKDYRKAVGKEGKQAQKDFADKQKEYDAQAKLVAELKEEYEQKKDNKDVGIDIKVNLLEQIAAEDEKLAKLKQELDAADKLNQKYDLMRQTLGDQADAIAKLMQVIAQNLQSLAELRDLLSDQFGLDLGDSLNGVIDGLAQTGQGISKAVSSAQSGDVFGVVSGAVGVFSGIADGVASIFGDGSARTRRLNKEIERSVETVRQLNLAYKELEYQVNRAMGAEEMRAKASQIENKKAQLEELKRQMQLEQRKRSKDRDDDAIKQYQESIKDLEIEIREMVENVTNDLLGGDLKAAAESFVDVWVQAWREGGDTMEALGDKFDDMIDNMIMKSIASHVVSQRLKRIWDEVDKAWADDSEGGSEITMNELSRIRALIGDKSIAEAINDDLTKLYGALGIAYGVDKDTDKNLSALQQGIQGVTEDTAGAIEAYMNIVSQRVFEQNLYLQEIRDHLNNFDLDVQLGTLSQMLLQLQQSYQVQQNIESILTGVLNPSGRAIVVELNS